MKNKFLSIAACALVLVGCASSAFADLGFVNNTRTDITVGVLWRSGPTSSISFSGWWKLRPGQSVQQVSGFGAGRMAAPCTINFIVTTDAHPNGWVGGYRPSQRIPGTGGISVRVAKVRVPSKDFNGTLVSTMGGREGKLSVPRSELREFHAIRIDESSRSKNWSFKDMSVGFQDLDLSNGGLHVNYGYGDGSGWKRGFTSGR